MRPQNIAVEDGQPPTGDLLHIVLELAPSDMQSKFEFACRA